MKHLEDLKIAYDNTVRDSANNVIQFLYGEDGIDVVNSNLLNGDASQMLFLARNYQALAYRFSIFSNYYQQGFDATSAVKYQEQLLQSKRLVTKVMNRNIYNNRENKSYLKKTSVVYARRKRCPELSWSRANMLKSWYPAEIIKIRNKENLANISFDIQYLCDHSVEKRVPLQMRIRPSAKHYHLSEYLLSTSANVKIPLLKTGVIDPVTSVLRLDQCIGSISESIIENTSKFVEKNVDGVIGDHPSDTIINPLAFQLLMNIKYLRSFSRVLLFC